ncbi:hypothetical protein GTGU_00746 [Trabulsiella guamensis ATCC 49490]|uniref:Uncharacterized protein n=1 Tax=Trabulsiella guamensis ATCC 49490 TaxID=1005994 RepID=A0A085AI54_9ENTR|nr:hypothetical protein GTGU_00746 [Trabulsiella guamensis ATCC 49490]
MVVSGQFQSVKPMCKSDDKVKASAKVRSTIPPSWKLTPQQQSFIDAFAEDESKKQ